MTLNGSLSVFLIPTTLSCLHACLVVLNFSAFNRQEFHLELNGTSAYLQPLVITAMPLSFTKPDVYLLAWRPQEDYVKCLTATRTKMKNKKRPFYESATCACAHKSRLKTTQRQNECACSAFWRASGHFLVSSYDQKAIITEKAPVLCSS